MSEPQLVTGEIVTMDPRRPQVQALAIDDGRIVGWGCREEAAALLPPGTPERRLEGRSSPA